MDNPFDAIMHELQDIKQQLSELRQPPKPREERMLSRREAAAVIGVTFPTLRRMVVNGQLKAVKVGDRKVLFSESDVRAVKQGLNPL
jgi:excisionase family DNA binding protein